MISPNPQLMTAVEQLGYRVTCGDVVAHSGIHLEQARSGLLSLANQTGGHLQVTETGEVIYVLAPDFRQVLLRQNVRLQVEAWLNRFGAVGFYLIKISFGILLISSITVVYLTILAITLAAIFSDNGGGDCGDGNCVLGICDFGSSSPKSSTLATTTNNSNLTPIREKTERKPINFLEAVFSVLFGDGDPNADLEQRRWRYIGNLIHRQQGVAIAEQIAPFLDDLGVGSDREYENYMLPVLTKFNGIPEVSPTGQLVYHFPDLQTTIKDDPTNFTRMPQCLRERKWKFTKATPEQLNWSIALFAANLVGIGVLAILLRGSAIGFAGGLLTVLALYGIGLITIPACRYLWVQYRDRQVRQRNHFRHQQVNLLQQNHDVPAKLDYAQQFAKQHLITDRDIIYTTEEDALDQEFKKLE
jgi:hypothetical protein